MARKFSFDELLAKREQREADRLKIGMFAVPGSECGLEARMPKDKVVLELFGELAAANEGTEALQCGNHAVYACCPQLWDKNLQTELGVQDDPMRIMDVLFTVSEQNQLGGQALQFLGLIPDQTPLRPDEEEQKKDPALETVKN